VTRSNRRAVIVAFCCLAIPASIASADPAPLSYTGTLAGDGSGDGQLTVDGWTSASISWTIKENLNDGTWHYKYVLAGGPMSAFILQASEDPPFHIGNIFNSTVAVTGDDIGVQSPADMPGSLYSVRFDPLGDATGLILEFDSTYDPTWGDAFLAGQAGSYAYNAGFTTADPQAAPDIGSLDDHRLVPGSAVVIHAPEPEAIILLALGLTGVAVAGRRHMALRATA
jgi:hypothetical protein